MVFQLDTTLHTDLAPLASRFEEVGLPGHLAAPWFLGTVRDGMALTVTGDNPAFADLGRAWFHTLTAGRGDAPADPAAAAEHVIRGFMALPLRPDVAPGLRALAAAGTRLVTLSIGSAAVAEGLLRRGGLEERQLRDPHRGSRLEGIRGTEGASHHGGARAHRHDGRRIHAQPATEDEQHRSERDDFLLHVLGGSHRAEEEAQDGAVRDMSPIKWEGAVGDEQQPAGEHGGG